jgi:hypothetical protein
VAGIYVRADVKGIDAIQRKLASAEPIFAEPWRKALETATDEAFESESRAISRFRTQGMQSHLDQKMDTRPIPEWGYVSLDAFSSHGPDKKRGGPFRYPWALNASERYHYAGTERTTKGWWDRPLSRMKQRVQELLEKAAREVEARWQQ